MQEFDILILIALIHTIVPAIFFRLCARHTNIRFGLGFVLRWISFVKYDWILGCSQVGKAAGFDPAMRRFESYHPSQLISRRRGSVDRGVGLC